MKANGLRPGNYVNDPVLGIVQLCQVGSTCRIDNKEKNPRNVEELGPIELTEEWLKGFGFIHDPYDRNVFSKQGVDLCFGYGYNSNELHYHLAFDFEKGCGYSCLYEPLLYVHQLQNLYYALTGEELTFKQ